MTNPIRHSFFAMGSPCELVLDTDSQFSNEEISIICTELEQEVTRLEDKYSRYKSTSLLSVINQNAGFQTTNIDQETVSLLNYANTAHTLSDGLFDITSGVLRRCWDFKSATKPNTSLIESTLKLVGWNQVEFTHNTVYLPLEGMEIDFGGIVKEYAADATCALAKKLGIAHGLVDLGGDIAVIGPQLNDQPWSIGISQPNNVNSAVSTLPATSGAVASSGDYERFIELDGKKYSHILNPKTGWPVSSFAGVSVWAEQCVVAGTVATIAMLKGKAEGEAWLRETELPFIAINQNGSIVN